MNMARRLVLIAWIVLCAVVLGMTEYVLWQSPQAHDVSLFFLGAMIVLTFPSGLLLLALVALLTLTDFTRGVLDWLSSALIGHLVIWAAMVALGYLQWFVWIPRLAKRVSRTSPGSAGA